MQIERAAQNRKSGRVACDCGRQRIGICCGGGVLGGRFVRRRSCVLPQCNRCRERKNHPGSLRRGCHRLGHGRSCCGIGIFLFLLSCALGVCLRGALAGVILLEHAVEIRLGRRVFGRAFDGRTASQRNGSAIGNSAKCSNLCRGSYHLGICYAYWRPFSPNAFFSQLAGGACQGSAEFRRESDARVGKVHFLYRNSL